MDSLDHSIPESHVTIYALDLQRTNKIVNKGYDLYRKYIDKDAPASLHHFGIAVFKKFYHFNAKGLNQSYEIPFKRVDQLPSRKTTKRTREEFEDWLLQPEVRKRFTAQKYHPIINNCIDFVKEACDFLDVEVKDGLILEIDKWLKTSETLKEVFKSRRLRKLFGIDVDGKKRGFVDSMGERAFVPGHTLFDEEDSSRERRTAVDSGGSAGFSDQELEIIRQFLSARAVREFLGFDFEDDLTECDDSDEIVWEPL